MTHDTPEAVEAMVEEMHFTVSDLPTEIGCMAAAAMLRRLHKRAVDAERERDGWRGVAEGKDAVIARLEASLTTARADAGGGQ